MGLIRRPVLPTGSSRLTASNSARQHRSTKPIPASLPAVMSSSWYHYHSALELLAGANLAIYAFPNIRRPAIEGEEDRWDKLLAAATTGTPPYPRVLEGISDFRREKQIIVQRRDDVRSWCLIVAILCVGTLLWATAWPEDQPFPGGPWTVILVSLGPAIFFFGLDVDARYRLRQSSAVRRSLESEVFPG
jgi:hypothetical protein